MFWDISRLWVVDSSERRKTTVQKLINCFLRTLDITRKIYYHTNVLKAVEVSLIQRTRNLDHRYLAVSDEHVQSHMITGKILESSKLVWSTNFIQLFPEYEEEKSTALLSNFSFY